MTHVLKQIIIALPAGNSLFEEKIISFFSHFTQVRQKKIYFPPSNPEFFPQISLEFQKVDKPKVLFLNQEIIEVPIENTTGIEKKSPHVYKSLSIEEITSRLEGVKIVEVDHVGFNLPWFDGIHPDILKLRTQLSDKSVYKLFPTGEPWDFILPASEKEIHNQETLDYTVVRRPKFEIVSFDKSSRPLIQFDLQIQADAQMIQNLFPEGIYDPGPNNVWVYLKNPYDLDICLVLNERKAGDWSEFFTSSPPYQSLEDSSRV